MSLGLPPARGVRSVLTRARQFVLPPAISGRIRNRERTGQTIVLVGAASTFLLYACGGDGFTSAAKSFDGGPRGSGGEAIGTGGKVGTGARSEGGASNGGASNGGASNGGDSHGGASSTGGARDASVSSGGWSGSGGGGSSGSGGTSSGAVSGSGGSPSSGGASSGGSAGSDAGVVEACALVTHDNGLGQAWKDCVPLGTYNVEQAMKACEASDAKTCSVVTACGPSAPEVRGYNADTTKIIGRWGYTGSLAGYVGTGSLGELCLGASDPNNRIWR